MKHSSTNTLSDLVSKASKIAGTELVHIAWQSKSPNHAAKLAAHLGHSHAVVQATRWAAVLAREEKKGHFEDGTFWRSLGPVVRAGGIDMPRINKSPFEFTVFSRATMNNEPLNATELSFVLSKIKEALAPLGIRVQVVGKKRHNEPTAISRLVSRSRHDNDT